MPLHTNSEHLVSFTNKQNFISIAFTEAILIMKLRWDFLFMMHSCLNHILALKNVFSFQTKNILSFHWMICVTHKQVQIELHCKHYIHDWIWGFIRKTGKVNFHYEDILKMVICPLQTLCLNIRLVSWKNSLF